MDGGACRATVHRVANSQTRLSNFTSLILCITEQSGQQCLCKGPDRRCFVASQVALVVKNPPASAEDIGDMGSIPGSGRSPGGGHGNPLQYSCLENPVDRGACQATIHGVAKSWT